MQPFPSISGVNAIDSHLHSRFSFALPKTISGGFMLLSQLSNGQHAQVTCVVTSSPEVGDATLRRLGELGFIEGEPVQMLHRGPGGREPLAVQVGDTMFALRLLEAQCIEVRTL
jgi:ferrous iron transport protein A